MIRWIVGSSLRFRLLVLGIAAGVMVVGITQLRNAPVDVLPEFTPPYVEVQTEALGLSAEEVEQLITVPLEADLLNGVEGVDVHPLELGAGPVLDRAGLRAGHRHLPRPPARAGAADAGARAARTSPSRRRCCSRSRRRAGVMMIGLSSNELSPIEQSVLARWTIRPRLMGVPGVANVAIWGQRDRQLQVQVDPQRLRDQRRHAEPGHRDRRQRAGGLAAELPRGVDARHRRVHRDAAAAPPGPPHASTTSRRPSELGKVPVEDTGGRAAPRRRRRTSSRTTSR